MPSPKEMLKKREEKLLEKQRQSIESAFKEVSRDETQALHHFLSRPRSST